MDIFDGIILLGFGLVVTGVCLLWSVPVGVLVAGIGLTIFGLAGARRKAIGYPQIHTDDTDKK